MIKKEYDFFYIEKKWQKHWDRTYPFKATDKSDKKIYVLEMFPYPSGAGLHVGHPEGYTAGDIIARMKRLQGYDVLHPMGWDAFGLPAEQYALKTGNHPAKFTDENIANFKKQIKSLGLSYDWDREVKTSDPEYYRWTQFIFLKLHEKGLAELRDTEVNWCEGLGTVLANEEIIEDANGNPVSERGNFPVTKKIMKQWVLKITEYADRLVDQLDLLDWEESIKSLQRNWIGREIDKNGNKTFKLRDWIFARQRYWGEPFPIVFDADCDPIKQNCKVYYINHLVELPHMENIQPSGTGEGPLANNKEWIYFEKDGKKYRRDTNVMPQWAGSCWYYLAYILKNPDGTYTAIDSQEAKERFKKWLPVDIYIGGQEHAVLHLIYARFWHMVLYDIGLVPTKEPFMRLVNQGMILGSDGTKMSKSVGNVINPDDIVNELGADTLRVYEMFMGPLSDDKPWQTSAIQGVHKWLNRVYRLFIEYKFENRIINEESNDNSFMKTVNTFVKEVTLDLESMKFNIAISKMMVFINSLYKLEVLPSKKILIDFAIILSTLAPHLAEELLSMFGENDLAHQTWPTYDPDNLETELINYPILINNKLRSLINVKPGLSQDEIINLAKNETKIKNLLSGKTIIKVIFVENKTINFLMKN